MCHFPDAQHPRAAGWCLSTHPRIAPTCEMQLVRTEPSTRLWFARTAPIYCEEFIYLVRLMIERGLVNSHLTDRCFINRPQSSSVKFVPGLGGSWLDRTWWWSVCSSRC